MAKRFCIFFIMLAGVLSLSAQREVYVSTSFHEPATDGLRFIYSYDGWHWDTIPGTWLKPEVGKQKVMRDPSIIRTPDGLFHLVWTSSWRGDRGFGYASSRDLKHWSQQRFIEVMPDTSTVNVWAPELFWDDIRKQAVIIWASCIPGKFPDGMARTTRSGWSSTRPGRLRNRCRSTSTTSPSTSRPPSSTRTGKSITS